MVEEEVVERTRTILIPIEDKVLFFFFITLEPRVE